MTKSKKRMKSKKQTKDLTAAQRSARRAAKQKYMTIFINGKQKRVPRKPTSNGFPVDEYLAANADPIWLHQNEMWEVMPPF